MNVTKKKLMELKNHRKNIHDDNIENSTTCTTNVNNVKLLVNKSNFDRLFALLNLNLL